MYINESFKNSTCNILCNISSLVKNSYNFHMDIEFSVLQYYVYKENVVQHCITSKLVVSEVKTFSHLFIDFDGICYVYEHVIIYNYYFSVLQTSPY
jgi:hypothetical protein